MSSTRYEGTVCVRCGRELGVRCAEVVVGICDMEVLFHILCERCGIREQTRNLNEQKPGTITRLIRRIRRMK
jgi:ribosomal protein L37E